MRLKIELVLHHIFRFFWQKKTIDAIGYLSVKVSCQAQNRCPDPVTPSNRSQMMSRGLGIHWKASEVTYDQHTSRSLKLKNHYFHDLVCSFFKI